MALEHGKVVHTDAAAEGRNQVDGKAVGRVADGSILGERSWDGSWKLTAAQGREYRAAALDGRDLDATAVEGDSWRRWVEQDSHWGVESMVAVDRTHTEVGDSGGIQGARWKDTRRDHHAQLMLRRPWSVADRDLRDVRNWGD